MKKLILLILLIFFFSPQILLSQGNSNSKDAKADNVYIPKNLEDCFVQIDKLLDDNVKADIKLKNEQDFAIQEHFGFGRWIRNNWLRDKKGSRLAEYFQDMGIFHPDDMSGIILVSYHRYLNNKDINLQEQIAYYRLYAKVHKEPLKEDYPEGEKELQFNTKLTYSLKDGKTPACIHVQTNSKTENTWIYDYHFGWKLLSKDEKARLVSAPQEREDILRELYKNER